MSTVPHHHHLARIRREELARRYPKGKPEGVSYYQIAIDNSDLYTRNPEHGYKRATDRKKVIDDFAAIRLWAELTKEGKR